MDKERDHQPQPPDQGSSLERGPISFKGFVYEPKNLGTIRQQLANPDSPPSEIGVDSEGVKALRQEVEEVVQGEESGNPGHPDGPPGPENPENSKNPEPEPGPVTGYVKVYNPQKTKSSGELELPLSVLYLEVRDDNCLPGTVWADTSADTDARVVFFSKEEAKRCGITPTPTSGYKAESHPEVCLPSLLQAVIHHNFRITDITDLVREKLEEHSKHSKHTSMPLGAKDYEELAKVPLPGLADLSSPSPTGRGTPTGGGMPGYLQLDPNQSTLPQQEIERILADYSESAQPEGAEYPRERLGHIINAFLEGRMKLTMTQLNQAIGEADLVPAHAKAMAETAAEAYQGNLCRQADKKLRKILGRNRLILERNRKGVLLFLSVLTGNRPLLTPQLLEEAVEGRLEVRASVSRNAETEVQAVLMEVEKEIREFLELPDDSGEVSLPGKAEALFGPWLEKWEERLNKMTAEERDLLEQALNEALEWLLPPDQMEAYEAYQSQKAEKKLAEEKQREREKADQLAKEPEQRRKNLENTIKCFSKELLGIPEEWTFEEVFKMCARDLSVLLPDFYRRIEDALHGQESTSLPREVIDYFRNRIERSDEIKRARQMAKADKRERENQKLDRRIPTDDGGRGSMVGEMKKDWKDFKRDPWRQLGTAAAIGFHTAVTTAVAGAGLAVETAVDVVEGARSLSQRMTPQQSLKKGPNSNLFYTTAPPVQTETPLQFSNPVNSGREGVGIMGLAGAVLTTIWGGVRAGIEAGHRASGYTGLPDARVPGEKNGPGMIDLTQRTLHRVPKQPILQNTRASFLHPNQGNGMNMLQATRKSLTRLPKGPSLLQATKREIQSQKQLTGTPRRPAIERTRTSVPLPPQPKVEAVPNSRQFKTIPPSAQNAAMPETAPVSKLASRETKQAPRVTAPSRDRSQSSQVSTSAHPGLGLGGRLRNLLPGGSEKRPSASAQVEGPQPRPGQITDGTRKSHPLPASSSAPRRTRRQVQPAPAPTTPQVEAGKSESSSPPSRPKARQKVHGRIGPSQVRKLESFFSTQPDQSQLETGSVPGPDSASGPRQKPPTKSVQRPIRVFAGEKTQRALVKASGKTMDDLEEVLQKAKERGVVRKFGEKSFIWGAGPRNQVTAGKEVTVVPASKQPDRKTTAVQEGPRGKQSVVPVSEPFTPPSPTAKTPTAIHVERPALPAGSPSAEQAPAEEPSESPNPFRNWKRYKIKNET